mgnify:CR=1 FL=1
MHIILYKYSIMSCILHIETSTEACSVAVSEDGLAVFSKEDLKGPSHAVQLGVFVDEALSFVDGGCQLWSRFLYRFAHWRFNGEGCLLWT